MKKIPKIIEHKIQPVDLYLDDVEAIINEFKKLPNEKERSSSYKVYYADYEIEESDDLSKIEIKESGHFNVRYSSFSPYGEFNLSIFNSAGIFKNTYPDPVFHGVFSIIESLLISRKRKTLFLRYLTLVSPVMAGFGILGVIGGQIWKINELRTLGIFLSYIAIAISLSSIFTRKYWISIVRLYKKDQSKTFWDKNRDAILLMLISGIFTFILGIATTIIVQKITTNP